MAALEGNYTPKLLMSCTSVFTGAGAGVEYYMKPWPAVLEGNLQKLLNATEEWPGVDVEVFSTAVGGSSSSWAEPRQAQMIGTRPRLLLSEYALNDGGGSGKGGIPLFRKWLQDNTHAIYPWTSFGFVMLPDDGNFHNPITEKCNEDFMHTNVLREEEFQAVELFSMSVCNYQKYYEALGKAQYGYDSVWSSKLTHIHGNGSVIVAELLEYAFCRAASLASEEICINTSHISSVVSELPPPTDQPLQQRGNGLPHPNQANSQVYIGFSAPNYGTFRGVGLRCNGMPDAVPLHSILGTRNSEHGGSKRGCFKTACKEFMEDNPQRCKVLPYGSEQCKKWHSMHGLTLTNECDASSCPPCIAAIGLLNPLRADSYYAIFLTPALASCSLPQSEHVVFDVPFDFTGFSLGANFAELVDARFTPSGAKEVANTWKGLIHNAQYKTPSAAKNGGQLSLCLMESAGAAGGADITSMPFFRDPDT
jgi:hypothetical protein